MGHHRDKDSSRHNKHDKKSDRSHKRSHSKSRDYEKERQHAKRSRPEDSRQKPSHKLEKVKEKNPTVDKHLAKNTVELLEEANKYRIQLGLKPITEEDIKGNEKTLNTASTIDEDVHKPALNIGDVQKSANVKDRLEILKEKNRMKIKYASLQKLGDVKEDDSLLEWINKSRSLEEQKKMAIRKLDILNNLEDEDLSNQVSSLPSVRVLHDSERFFEGREVILTLKDKNVLDENEDELVNVNLVDIEKGEENTINSGLNPSYKPWDDNEFENELNQNKYDFNNKKLLAKYNERIDGKTVKSFQLDESGKFDLVSHNDKVRSEKQSNFKKEGMVSLSTLELKPVSDYLPPAKDLKFKKIHRKCKLRTKNSRTEEYEFPADDIKEEFTTENCKPLEKSKKTVSNLKGLLPVIFSDIKDEQLSDDDLGDLNFAYDEDDDIDMQLNDNLKRKQLNELKLTDYTIPRNVTKETEDIHLPYKVGLIIDDMSEFYQELKTPQLHQAPLDRLNNDESDDSDEIVANRDEQMSKSGNDDVLSEENIPKPFMMESTVLNGISGAMLLARQKGYLEHKPENKVEMSESAKELCSKNYSVELRRVDEGDSRQRRRETRYDGNLVEFKEKNIKPKFKLEYTNDKAEILTPKEAFRYLSHRFHGKGPGKIKLEKRAKKNEDNKKLLYMDEHDTPLSSLKQLKEKQRKEKSSYLVISGSKCWHGDKVLKK